MTAQQVWQWMGHRMSDSRMKEALASLGVVMMLDNGEAVVWKDGGAAGPGGAGSGIISTFTIDGRYIVFAGSQLREIISRAEYDRREGLKAKEMERRHLDMAAVAASKEPAFRVSKVTILSHEEVWLSDGRKLELDSGQEVRLLGPDPDAEGYSLILLYGEKDTISIATSNLKDSEE